MTETDNQEKSTKPQKAPSSVRWYAFIVNKDNHQVKIVNGATQKELKKELCELAPAEEVHSVIKGKIFKTKVQRSFEFLDRAEKDVEIQSDWITKMRGEE